MQLNPRGRDWTQVVNWDDLGKLYAGFIVAWTVILASGMIWLIVNRRTPSVKIRCVTLAITAVAFLQVYLIKIFLAYTTNGHFTCGAEYWIMSIYLPFGIALFQANTVQLLSISEQQESLLRRDTSSDELSKGVIRPGQWLVRHWRAATPAKRTYAYIGLGMLVQLVITGVLYATTPTLQGNWSSFGNITHAQGQAKCRKSLEWIPTALWQLFWAWIYGPYVLYKVRHINDVHYWRIQVFLSVVSGLPGAPLWLMALYGPKSVVGPINKWWVPPMWLAPGIIVMQAVTIFFPIYEAYKDRWQLRRTLGIIQTWENRRKNDEFQSLSNGTSFASSEKRMSRASTVPDPAKRRSEMYTMAALEKALAVNPMPLLQFAATQDFTAENIVFLTQVRRWYAEWDRLATRAHNGEPPTTAQAYLFSLALDIYVTTVSERTAEFPVNISGNIRSTLDAVFGSAAKHYKTHNHSPQAQDNTHDVKDPLFPPPSYQIGSLNLMRNIIHREPSEESDTTLWDGVSIIRKSEEVQKKASFKPHPCVRPLWDESPAARNRPTLGRDVFRDAEDSVKYLVLTNTWQKLVKAHDHIDLS